MTVAVYVKVFDGIVLATDSATTLTVRSGLFGLGKTEQVYNNADKIFHLHRQLPIAAMTWGLGVVGPASISSLSKSFRLGLMGRDPAYPEVALDAANFSVKDVAERASGMFGQAARDANLTKYSSQLGYLVTGISSDSAQAEAWLLRFQGTDLEPQPEQILTDADYGFRAYAQPEAVNRLFNGYDDALYQQLVQAAINQGQTPEQAEQQVNAALAQYRLEPVPPAMPLPDAIALARFMVETTAGYARYRLGPDTVGGPVEVASISPHEGFKWIGRKHYYSPALNPGEQP